MKKSVVASLAICFAALLFQGCGDAGVPSSGDGSVREADSEAGEKSAKADQDGEEELDEAGGEGEQEASDDVPGDEVLSNKIFSITMPSEYAGTYEAEYDDEFNSIVIYDTASKEAGAGGMAFAVYAFKDPSDYAWMPGGTKAGELTAADGTLYDIVLGYPTDVQWDVVNGESESYNALYDAAPLILESLQGADGGSYRHGAGMKGEELYPEILEKHLAAITEQWNAYRLEEEEMSPMYYAMSRSGGEAALERLGYLYQDINNDGVDELLIGEILDNEQKGCIFDIYTMADRAPAHVVSGWVGNVYYVLDGFSLLSNEYFNGMKEEGCRIYGVTPNEGSLYPQIGYKIDRYENEDQPWFVSYDLEDAEAWENVTEEEWEEIRKPYTEYYRPDFIPFSSLLPVSENDGGENNSGENEGGEIEANAEGAGESEEAAGAEEADEAVEAVDAEEAANAEKADADETDEANESEEAGEAVKAEEAAGAEDAEEAADAEDAEEAADAEDAANAAEKAEEAKDAAAAMDVTGAAEGSDDAETAAIANMINPWSEITEEEASSYCERLFRAPDGAENVVWRIMESAADPEKGKGPLLEMCFDLDGLSFNARAWEGASKEDDIAGMYYEWENEEEGALSGWGSGMMAKIFSCVGKNESAVLCTWYDEALEISYSLSAAAPEIPDGFDILVVANAIAG